MIVNGLIIEPSSNLAKADLTWAKLNGVRLSEANLADANLTKADLTNANLTRAVLTNANLAKADLKKADFAWADLANANLAGADLTKSSLVVAKLTNANLTGADLSGADLRGADFTGAKGFARPEVEMQIIQWIHKEIVGQDRLEQHRWHSKEFPWEDVNYCNTARICVAGFAQIWAHTNNILLPGGKSPFEVEPSVAGSSLVPTLSPLFLSNNEEMINAIKLITSGGYSLIVR